MSGAVDSQPVFHQNAPVGFSKEHPGTQFAAQNLVFLSLCEEGSYVELGIVGQAGARWARGCSQHN
jgi:hypothetical protein